MSFSIVDTYRQYLCFDLKGPYSRDNLIWEPMLKNNIRSLNQSNKLDILFFPTTESKNRNMNQEVKCEKEALMLNKNNHPVHSSRIGALKDFSDSSSN